jgi:hypothetical protein
VRLASCTPASTHRPKAPSSVRRRQPAPPRQRGMPESELEPRQPWWAKVQPLRFLRRHGTDTSSSTGIKRCVDSRGKEADPCQRGLPVWHRTMMSSPAGFRRAVPRFFVQPSSNLGFERVTQRARPLSTPQHSPRCGTVQGHAHGAGWEGRDAIHAGAAASSVAAGAAAPQPNRRCADPLQPACSTARATARRHTDAAPLTRAL